MKLTLLQASQRLGPVFVEGLAASRLRLACPVRWLRPLEPAFTASMFRFIGCRPERINNRGAERSPPKFSGSDEAKTNPESIEWGYV